MRKYVKASSGNKKLAEISIFSKYYEEANLRIVKALHDAGMGVALVQDDGRVADYAIYENDSMDLLDKSDSFEILNSESIECTSSTGATRITDLPDDTVIHVDEVLDYARKYMKPEDIDHHGNGRGMDDLYLRVNDVSKWIVNHMDNTALVSKFVDNIDHVWWYELPFLYND